jgi:hypothetical protein
MGAAGASDAAVESGFLANAWARTGALRASIVAGAIFGAVFGGAGGRIVMRLIALIDQSTDGVQTDSGTVGEITAGGTFGLMQFGVGAGIVGGLLYLIVRRWLPWSGIARGVAFGLFIVFVPGILVFNKDNPDLQIFEPVLPILAMFIVLVALYGIAVALLVDRLHAAPPVQRGPRVDAALRATWCLVAAAMCVISVFGAMDFNDRAGSCLSADQNGGCAVRTGDAAVP